MEHVLKQQHKIAAAERSVKLSVRPDGVAVITINNPPKNALNNRVMAGLELRFQESYTRPDIKAIVLAGSGLDFCVGVDISIMQKVQKEGCDEETRLIPPIPFISMIEDGPKPVVAAVRGAAMGGGLEISMACHCRMAHPSAKFSLPDLHIGIIPGLGGTQRLPRLVGVKQALHILQMTRPLTAMEAMKAGLIDDIVVNGDVLEKASIRALEICNGKFPWKKSLERSDRLGQMSESLQIFRRARVQFQKDQPNLVHPLLCIDVMEEGIRKGGMAGAIMEESFSHGLIFGPTAKALMHVFFARRLLTKIPGLTNQGLKPQKICHAGVVGCGPTGAAIATCFILSKIPVYWKGDNESDLQLGIGIIKESLQTLVSNTMALDLITCTTDYKHFRNVDIVIEAMEDGPRAESGLFLQELAQICHPDTIYATTSSFSGAKNSGLVTNGIIGMHFVSPAYKTELVEISLTKDCTPQAVVNILALVQSMNKMPLVVKSSEGSPVVDRLRSVLIASMEVVAAIGVDRLEINACLEEFGMTIPTPSIADSQNSGILLARSSALVFAERGDKATLPTEDIIDLVLFPVVNEALQILHSGHVDMAEHMDMASILGLGFPSYRGGILFWAHTIGIGFIMTQLHKWSKKYGACFEPCFGLNSISRIPQDQKQDPDQAIARL